MGLTPLACGAKDDRGTISSMGERLDRERWALVAKRPPAIPSRNGELAWIGTRLEQMEDSQELLTYEVVRIVGNSDLIARLISQFQEDAQFRRRWEHTEFIFMSSYWEIDGDDNHWYSMGDGIRRCARIGISNTHASKSRRTSMDFLDGWNDAKRLGRSS